MSRFPDWPDRLAQYIASRRDTPFSYGNSGHDCCQFAAMAVEAITGTNPAANWHYSCELGAAMLIKKAGGLESLITEALGEPVHVSRAGRGDIVLAELDRGDTIGVCLGRDCVFPADVGTVMRPRASIRVAWKV
jgi:hypothetical protein